MLEDPFELRSGAVVEGCRIVQRLGQGRFGVAYEAREGALGARVAIYALHRSMLSRPNAAERFEQWARSFAAIRHSHLSPIHTIGSHNGQPFFLSELPDAETLYVRLMRAGSLPIQPLADLMLPILSVFRTTHENRSRQRATPYSVFLPMGADGVITPRLVNYAVSEALAAGDTDGPERLTPYLSPEEARGGAPVEERSDLWSVGVLLYLVSTGRLPYTGEDRESVIAAMLTRPAPSPRALRPLPASFDALVVRSLARAPKDRVASTYEVARALLPFASPAVRARWSAEFGEAPAPEPTIQAPARPPPSMTPPSMTPPSVVPLTAVKPLPATQISLEARRQYIRRVPLFAALSNDDVESLAVCLRWRTLPAWEVLYNEGESGDTLAFIAEGSVVVRVERLSATHEIAVLGVGSVIGEMACLDPAPRSATVETLSEVIVGELSRDGLSALAAHAPALATLVVGEVIRNVARKIHEVERLIDDELAPERAPEPESSPDETLALETSPSPKPRGMLRFVDFLRRIA